ncbi:LysR substrate-binding domain-containing protein [Frisingicoccus sp.]|uniref:LysR family transcriptional regulator n=1 Tax=Frisingicoccus sp. TaxID=1918627 RepID=UPI003AB896B5
MDIRELKYLYEISQCGSMEQAANRLFITQPSLTKTVKKMESELGFKLFERVGRRNVLTLAGKDVINLSRPVLNAYDYFEENLKSIGSFERATVNYGVIPLYQTPFTSNFIYNFRRKYPHIKINIHELPEETIKQLLITGELDVGMTENMLVSPYIITYSGFEDEVAVAVGEGNEFYDAKQLTFEDLRNSIFNIVTSGHNNYNQIISNCRKAGYEPEVAYQSSQIGLLLEYTVLNKGVCIFNRCMIYDNLVVRPHLKTMRIIPLVPPPQCFCWVSLRKQTNIPQAIQIFADELTDALTEDVAIRVQ